MAIYKYSKQSGLETNAALKKILPILAIAAIGPLAMFYASLPEYFLPFLVFYIAIIAFAFFVAIYLQSRSLLILEKNQVTFRRSGKPDVNILRTEVKKIVQRGEHGIAILSQGPADDIFIPISIEGYEAIRNELNTWYPIEPELSPDNRLLIFTISIIALSSISAVCAFVFKIKIFFYIFALSFVVIFIGSIIESFKKTGKKRTEGQRSSSLIQRIIFGLVVVYFVYKIIISFL
jgi:hypothetical protein